MTIFSTEQTRSWWDWATLDAAFQYSSLVSAGDGVIDMAIRGVCAAAVTAGLSLGLNCAVADEVAVAQVDEGGAVTFDPPGNLSHSVYVDLRGVRDRQGRVASFRFNAFRNGVLVESQRVTVLEPGGKVRRFFRRPFHELEIADAEGSVSGQIAHIGFCPLQMYDDLTCREKSGPPTPLQMVEAPVSAGPIASPNPGSPPSGGAGDPPSSPSSPDNLAGTPPPAPPVPSQVDGQPVFGETTPITRLTRISVQGAPGAGMGYKPTTPWLDQAKLSRSWKYLQRTRLELTPDKVALDDRQLPVMPAAHGSGTDYVMDGGLIWGGAKKETSRDLAGVWRLDSPAGVEMSPRLWGVTVRSQTAHTTRFSCAETDNCRLNIQLKQVAPGSAAPTLIQTRDGQGNLLPDVTDHQNGLVTRSRWRKALYGYTDLRMMHYSGATTPTSMPIRFDQFPDLDDASWANTSFFVPFRYRARDTARAGWADLTTGKGMKKVFTPVEARLRAAYEIGAVYHHNFPHLFLEYKSHVEPSMIGQWAVDLFARSDLTDDQKRALFNDYELQHVDEFGALVASHQDLLVNNQIKIEVGNEVWNHGWPYFFGRDYYSRKAERYARENGWGELPGGTSKGAIALGYDLTKTIARLRKRYPQVEWRGVMAVQTADVTMSRSGAHRAPATPHDWYNRFLHGMIIGYEFFWQDYANNESEWSAMYAPQPSAPGDWFEAQGTTYYRIEAKRSDMKTHLAGFSPEDLIRRTRDEQNWPQVRQEILEWFFDPSQRAASIDSPRGQRSGQSDLGTLTKYFRALSEHAAAYGMQVTAYEGGSHARLGSYYKRNDPPEHLVAFWRNFHDSVENALIQSAVNDAAINAGWMGLSDFDLFQNYTDGGYIFGTRKSFDDVTPRWCEYVRWMPTNKEPPVGMSASDVVDPKQKCGGLIDYLNQAAANGYYAGDNIPEASTFLQ